MTIALTAAAAILLLGALAWLLFGPPKTQPQEVSPLEIKKLLPVHCRSFPQIQRTLNRDDENFLSRRVSKSELKTWRSERSDVLRLYVQALAEDFQHLQQLARLMSTLSPELRPSQEFELFTLALQFRVLYQLTMLRLAIRSLPLPELSRLTEIVAVLGFELETFLDQMVARVPEAGTGSAA